METVVKLALLSDIHGNASALEAVLADIRAQGGVDQHVLVGDYLAIGPDPEDVLAQLLALPNAVFVRGNTDHDLLHLWPPVERFDPARPLPEPLPYYMDILWTCGAVSQPAWLDWLDVLPVEQRLNLPDGTRLLAVHASPGQHDGPGFHPRRTQAQMMDSLVGCAADLVVVGHSHVMMDLRVDNIRVFNLGNVSLPMAPDPDHKELRASYAVLQADAQGYRIQHRLVDYEREAVIARANRRRHPSADLIAEYLRGDKAPWWLKP